MKRKLNYILLILLCLIPFVKANAASKSDVFSTTPKKGYRCYYVCQTANCMTKMTIYTNRDMSDVKTYTIDITPNGNKENIVDSNAGLNLFAKRIRYADAQDGLYYNIAQYYNKALNDGFDFGHQTNIKEQVGRVQKSIKSKVGNKYDSVIKQFDSYNENSDIDSFSCMIAAETIDIVNSNAGSLAKASDGHYKYVYEEDYNGSRSVYNISVYDMDKWPNLDDWLFLEGTGFYVVRQSLSDGESTMGSFIRTETEDILKVPKITDTNDSSNKTASKQLDGIFDKTKGNKLKELINNVKSAEGTITHEQLIDFLGCVKVNHNLTEVEQQCKTEFEAAGKKTSGKEWKECLRNKGYTWTDVCDTGFTFGVLPQLKNAEETQQDAINTAVSNGIYRFEQAAFELMASGTAISCYNIRHATYVWRAICILAPFLLIIFGSLDFIKAIMAADEKAQKEARKKLPKRIIAFVLFLILPVILRIIFKVGAYNSGNLGLLKCVVTFDTTSITPINKSKSAEQSENNKTKKMKCDDYGIEACPIYPESDDYGYYCEKKAFADEPEKIACQRTGESKKHCTQYAMSGCKEQDDYGKECTLIKKEGQSVPVCDYK